MPRLGDRNMLSCSVRGVEVGMSVIAGELVPERFERVAEPVARVHC